MASAPHMSDPNAGVSRAAPGSAFPPALPPRAPVPHPMAQNIMAQGSMGQESMAQGSSPMPLVTPLITAADYSDRQRLLSHVTLLSGQLQRAELLLRGAAPDAALAAAFDPHIAQLHITRLDSALAQVALLREVELKHCRAVEDELRALREERVRLVARVDAAESRAAALEGAGEQQRAALAAAELQLAALSSAEAAAAKRAGAMEALRRDGGRFDGVRVVIAPPRPNEPPVEPRRAQLQEDEASARAALLLEMLMEPMAMAFDAGVVWITETQRLRDEGRDALRRVRQLLRDEQRRTEEMAMAHCAQLEKVHEQIVHERRLVAEGLTAEVEERMRYAFRDGRLYEKRLVDERRRLRRGGKGAEGKASPHAKKSDGGECDTASKRC